jgi:hypothetical protein
MAAKEVTTRAGKGWIEEGLGIARFKCFHGVYSRVEDVKANLATLMKLVEGKPYPLVIDVRGYKGADPEGLAYSRTALASVCSALALVGGTPMSNVFGSVYMAVYKSCVPTKLFAKETEAIAWARGYIG